MNILFLGDVMGKSGRQVIKKELQGKPVQTTRSSQRFVVDSL